MCLMKKSMSDQHFGTFSIHFKGNCPCPDQVSIVVLQLNRNLGTFSVAMAADPITTRHLCQSPSAGQSAEMSRGPPRDCYTIYRCIYIYNIIQIDIYIYTYMI